MRYLLSGSVRRAGTALRISAHLVDTEDDRQVWGGKYSGTLDDVFDLQERVSREIVAALGITLQPDEDRRFAARSFRHAEAFELYLHARGEMQMVVSTSDEKWRGLLARAVALEGETPSLRGLRVWGEIMLLKAGAGDRSRIGDIEREAHDLVKTAPDAPWGYSALGYAAIEAGNMRSAITWLRQALARDPTDTDSRYWLVTAYAYGGLLEEAADAAVDMFAIDPLSSSSAIAGIVGTYFMGKRDGVLATVLRVLAAEPNNFTARPVENISVDPERNRPFRHRLDHLRRGPEVIRQAS